jgi:cell division protein FtsN
MPETPDPRQQAAAKRRAREQRIRDLRTRVVAVAVALFVAVWTGLYIQLVSGHDPALASETKAVTQSAAPAGETWSDDAATDTWSDDSTDATASQPAAVTTRQS